MYYKEEAKEVEVYQNVDVLVVGAGPAGFGAAVSAARAGAETLLIEQGAGIGGVATMGLMSHWTGDTYGPIVDELRYRACDTDKDYNYYEDKVLTKDNIINPEKTKLVMMDMLKEAGVKWRLFTFASAAIVEDNTVKGIIIESKAGRQAIYAKVVIDASGDGDIAAKSGAEFTLGREEDNLMQPMTVMFKVANVDYSKAIFPGEFDDEIDINGESVQKLGRQYLESPIGHVLLYPTTMHGVVTVNMTNSLGKSGLEPDDLSSADYECRKQIPEIIKFLKDNVPGYKECFLMQAAPAIGVRETRHFKGVYSLTEDDIMQARVFKDWIATRCFFNFDVHNMTGSGLDDTGEQANFPESSGYTIPLGSILPDKINGLLLAGRNISGTHMAHSNYRAMPICVNIGEGAGVVAAISIQDNVLVRDVDIDSVQEILSARGAKI